MKDYKNSTVKSSLTAWDYAAAAGFILTMVSCAMNKEESALTQR